MSDIDFESDLLSAFDSIGPMKCACCGIPTTKRLLTRCTFANQWEAYYCSEACKRELEAVNGEVQ